MTREIAHQKSFEKALYSIDNNFPPGKLAGDQEFTNVYFDMSQGEGNTRGPWNEGEEWEFVADREDQAAVDGGDGMSSVELDSTEAKLLKQTMQRTRSDRSADPTTGADLGRNGGSRHQ